MERVDGAIRSVIQQLERKSTLDLPQRLASAVADVEDEFDVAIHLEMSDLAREASAELRRPTVEAVVKVARESLVNAAKHAAPFRAAVSLDADQQQLCLTVLDDGVGPGPPGRPAGHGIRSLERVMTEQGGSLKVAAGAAGGTTVTAVIPR
jgi:signal transduction histidine kinase